MKDELLNVGKLNVIVVDWAGGSLPLYTQVRFVGGSGSSDVTEVYGLLCAFLFVGV